ncbi:hypothetical protein B0A52_00183 [Exophiala mesophila]|uniref:Transmembrane protein n=1 Tax=Exophiala mesophila TaxID=212818 RepID=A0A438NJB2_EXOME|nr:hypothetical protein B0A52_00183 [Exophiala mesophila]
MAIKIPSKMPPWLLKTWFKIKDSRRRWFLAILCNPTLVLHTINLVLSLLHPHIILGPGFATWVQPHLDVHTNDDSCKVFVIFMVALQMTIFVPITRPRQRPDDSCDSLSIVQ